MAHAHARAVADNAMVLRRARFTVGRNARGRWVLLDRDGRVGGLFTTQSAALRYALELCDGDAMDIRRATDDEIVEPTPLSLDARPGVH